MRSVLAAALALGLGCQQQGGHKPFTQPMVLGGQTIPASVLNDGREAFMLYCYACHGDKGEGNGPSSPGLRPPPRNFAQGLFKFAGVPAGELPNDEDLDRTIRRGLHGTPMLAWDIPPIERYAIIQYIKTLSPRWQKEKPGQRVLPSPDPWKGREAEAIEKGKGVYHVKAMCATCHPSYITRQEFSKLQEKLLGSPKTEFAAEMYVSTLRESDYFVKQKVQNAPAPAPAPGAGTDKPQPPAELAHGAKPAPDTFLDYKVKILPVDFLYNRVKNGTELDELYRTIGSGIGGAAMPQWKGALPEDELWALVYYVKSVIDARDTARAAAMRAELAGQPAWVPRPPPPPAPEEPTEPPKKAG